MPGLACHFQHILFYLVKQVARPAQIQGVGKKPTSDGRSCRELAALCSILSISPFATVVSTVPPSRGHSPSPSPLHLSPPGGALPTLGCSLLGCIWAEPRLPARWDPGCWAQHEALRAGSLGKSPRSDLGGRQARDCLCHQRLSLSLPLSFSLCLSFSFCLPLLFFLHCSLHLPHTIHPFGSQYLLSSCPILRSPHGPWGTPGWS